MDKEQINKLVEQLQALVIIDEVRSNNPLGREAATAIKTLQSMVDKERTRAETAEAERNRVLELLRAALPED